MNNIFFIFLNIITKILTEGTLEYETAVENEIEGV